MRFVIIAITALILVLPAVAAPGDVLGNFILNDTSHLTGLTYDASTEDCWVLDFHTAYDNNLRVFDGAFPHGYIGGWISTASDIHQMHDIGWDGTYLYGLGKPLGVEFYLYCIDPSDGTTLSSSALPYTTYVHGLAADENNVYVSASKSQIIYKLTKTGGIVDSYDIGKLWSRGIAENGDFIYVVSEQPYQIHCIAKDNMSLVSDCTITSLPNDIWLGGASWSPAGTIFVTEWPENPGVVYEIEPPSNGVGIESASFGGIKATFK